MAGKTFDRSFNVSATRLFAAAVRAAAALGYSVISSDKEAGILSFNTGRSWKSWAGQDMTATIISESADRAKVILGGATAMRGNPFGGGGGQLAAWGEKKAVAYKFLDQIAGVLPTVAEERQASEQGSVSIAAELERLAALRQQGLLSDAEFESAKSRLLG